MVNFKFLSLAVTALIFLLSSGFSQVPAAQYPLKLSIDNRHLEDQAGIPFFINGDTPWSLIVGLTKAEAEVYLEDRRSRGFNAIVVNLIEHKFGGPANRDGELPFSNGNIFTEPNEAYFQHADWVINKAAEKGLLVVLTPVYIGYKCDIEGWCQEMLATSLNDLQGYGNYIGNRYKDNDNIIWMHGGDAAAADWGALAHVNAVADGVRQADPDNLFTAHCKRWQSAIDCYNETWLQINNTYSDCDASANATKTDYLRSPVIPFFYSEGRYEGDGSSQVCHRSQAYWSALGGSTGHFFGNNPIWLFASGWQQALNAPGSQSMTHFGALFASRPWTKLVPDYNETIVSGNRGNISTADYIMAASASDGSVILAYMPIGRTITVDLTHITATSAEAWWYNPTTGSAQSIGNFATIGLQDFTPPDSNDWVLVIDNADMGFPSPGTGIPPLSACADGIDNDADGLTDFPSDPGCIDASDDDENNTPPPTTQCNDGIDNDGDGLIDFPDDPGCIDVNDNNEANTPPPTAQCSDGTDNDGDGLIDFPNDPGCIDASDDDESNTPPTTTQCNDGIDNDGDGLTDFPNDPGCIDANDDDESNTPPTTTQCNDGTDNDGDGLIDFPNDPDCIDANDDDESNTPPTTTQCNDGIDNDGDGLTDFPSDSGCSDTSDNDESNVVPPVAQCGDGVDNDNDNFTDYPADPGCSSSSDNDETNVNPPPNQGNNSSSSSGVFSSGFLIVLSGLFIVAFIWKATRPQVNR